MNSKSCANCTATPRTIGDLQVRRARERRLTEDVIAFLIKRLDKVTVLAVNWENVSVSFDQIVSGAGTLSHVLQELKELRKE